MTNDRPPETGRLIVLEPSLPEDQFTRRFRTMGPNVGHEPTWIFKVTEPMGWKGSMTNRLLLSPRNATSWIDRKGGHLHANGCLWFDDPKIENCGLIVQLESE